jgi:hypothetical protein
MAFINKIGIRIRLNYQPMGSLKVKKCVVVQRFTTRRSELLPQSLDQLQIAGGFRI